MVVSHGGYDWGTCMVQHVKSSDAPYMHAGRACCRAWQEEAKHHGAQRCREQHVLIVTGSPALLNVCC